MTRALLDVNVPLALLDADHVDHRTAQDWIASDGDAWASCAIAENGFVRIVSQLRYPSPVAPVEAVAALADACAQSDHEFWPCRACLCSRQIQDQLIDSVADRQNR